MTSTLRSIDRIITAKDFGGSLKGYIQKCQRDIHRTRGIAITIKDLDKPAIGQPVYARIWQAHWIADCECMSASMVDPDDPKFFCFGCGNRGNGGKPRPVVFPPEDERREIERLLLERPVSDMGGLTDLERVGMQQAVLYVDIEEEVLEPRQLASLMDGVQQEEMPPLRKRLQTLPLTRSWEPGETLDDLHQQQDQPIENWKRALRTAK